MKGINLQRTINVCCWHVIGQVAKAAKRDELMPVLLRARERGVTDAGDVAEHLLFDSQSRRVVAQRLLQIAQHYGLLAQTNLQYVLTESGHQAIAKKQVFIPEYGTWTIWASDDPLLATPILHVEPWREPSAFDEVWDKKRDSDRERRFEELPQWVQNAVGNVAVHFGGAPLRIDQLEAKGESANLNATLHAKWDVSVGRLRLEGTLGDTPINTVIDAPEVDADDVWMQLLQAEGLWSQWDTKAVALLVRFEEAALDERESMVRTVAFGKPHITGLGPFDAMKVAGIALRAKSAGDATRWAEWRLLERVRDYATEEAFREWTAKAVAPFSEFNPSTPTRQALADAEWRARTDRPTTRAWHLVAAEDWGL